MKRCVNNVNEMRENAEHGQILVALDDVQSWTGVIQTDSATKEYTSQMKRFRAGDVIFGKLRPYLAKVARPDYDGFGVSEFLVLRSLPGEIRGEFLEHLLRSKPVIDAIDGSTFGAKMPRTDWHFMGNLSLPLPPLPEQRAIAKYLDYMDRRIQRYITAKERLIELLAEEKRAVINHAVTRGLDPDVPLKPSGVEWLGEIPAHWEVVPIKRVAHSIQTGSTPPTNVAEYFEVGSLPWYGPSDFSPDLLLRSARRRIATQAIDDRVARLFPPGTVMVISIGATIGKVGMIVEPSTCNQQINAITYSRQMLPMFGALQLKTFERHIQAISPSTTLPILNQTQVGYLPSAFPQIDEQTEIVDHIRRKSAKMDKAIAAGSNQIELMKEYRTRLIADVVTGKLDVREAAASLPDDDADEVSGADFLGDAD